MTEPRPEALTAEEEAEARTWVESRQGKPASRGMLLAVRLLATLDAARAPRDDLNEWPDRAWLVSHWVGHRCGYVDCRTTEQHEHGGGQPMREMTPDELAREEPSDAL